MSKKKTSHQKTRTRLGRVSPASIAGALVMTAASYYADKEPEVWQGKGKRPMGKIK